jgi:hypothetical protein
MTEFQGRFPVFHAVRHVAASAATTALLVVMAAGCASNASKASSTVSDTDFGRLSATQIQPVEDARAELERARDELGRAQRKAVDDQHEGALARSDQGAAAADVSRATANTAIGKDSNEPAQIQQARDDTRDALHSQDVAAARLAYSKKLEASQAARIRAAERKVDLMTEKVNLAKLQSLDDAAVPAAQKYDRATAMERVVSAQRAYDSAEATAGAALGETTTAKQHWKALADKQM